MGLIVSESSSGNRALVPAGTHAAVCIGIYDLGVQPGGEYAPKPKVMFRYELPEETVDRDGQHVPQTMTKEFTLSLNEKGSLRPWLESWRGRQFTADELKRFDLRDVLGKACMVNVVHEQKGERTYDNIKTVMPLPKGMRGTIPTHSFHEPLIYDRDATDEADVRAKLPEWIVKNRLDRIVAPAGAVSASDARTPPAEAYAEDDIPF